MNWIFGFAAAALFLWCIAFWRLRAYIRRHTGVDYILQNLREEIRLLEADIDAKTEQNLTLLEERIKALRELCSEAEKRIIVYSRELDRKNIQDRAFAEMPQAVNASAAKTPGKNAGNQPPENASPSGTKIRKKPAAVPAQKKRRSRAPEAGDRNSKSLLDSIEVKELLVTRANSAYTAEAGKTAVPETSPRFVRSENPVIPKPPPLRQRVAELYRAGFSEDLIAVKLGASINEVRLCIELEVQ